MKGRGPLSSGKREDMEIGEGKGVEQLPGMLKPVFCLPWKSHNHIRADAEVWNNLMKLPEEAREKRAVIVPVHPLQNLIISALDRDVKVGADLGRSGGDGGEAGGK